MRKPKSFLAFLLSAGLIFASSPGAENLFVSEIAEMEAAQETDLGFGAEVLPGESLEVMEAEPVEEAEGDVAVASQESLTENVEGWDEEEALSFTDEEALVEAALSEENLEGELAADSLLDESLFGDAMAADENAIDGFSAEALVEAVTMAAVGNLKVSMSPKNGYIKMSFSSVDGASRYTASYKDVNASSWTKVKSTATTIKMEGLTKGDLYKLRVRAVTGKNTGTYTYRFRWLQVPTVSVKAGENQIQVTIQADGGEGDVSYKIYLSQNEDFSGKSVQSVSKDGDKTTVVIDGLEGGSTYYVKVRPQCDYNGKTYIGKTSKVKTVTVESEEEESEESEEFTDDSTFDNTAWSYNSSDNVYYQLGIAYCDSPVNSSLETLAIFVPGDFFEATSNGDGTYTCTVNTDATVGGYKAQKAPIVMPINTPGYSSQSALTSYTSVSSYTSQGFVYVHAGCRGRDNGAPTGVTDLKAAVKYLRYTDAAVPGSAEKIFTFGMSGGGAQSALMGSTGDSSLYDPYLEAIGAKMDYSDAVYGSMCWCPITNLDSADEAYEWMMGCTRSGLSTEDQSVSDALAEAYASYINDIGLTNANGKALTLKASSDGIYQAGSYYNYMVDVIETSLNNFLEDTTFPYSGSASTSGGPGGGGGFSGGPGGTPPWQTSSSSLVSASGTTYETAQDYIDSLNSSSEWVTYDSSTNTVTVSSMEGFVTACKNASKSLGAFDTYSKSSAENTLFGDGNGNAAHFDATLASILTSLGSSYASEYTSDMSKTDSFGTSVQTRLDMYTPLYYLAPGSDGYGTSQVASHWRIRTGITQGDCALCTEVNLMLALEQYSSVSDVDFATVWAQGHTQAERTGSASSNFISWVNSCM